MEALGMMAAATVRPMSRIQAPVSLARRPAAPAVNKVSHVSALRTAGFGSLRVSMRRAQRLVVFAATGEVDIIQQWTGELGTLEADIEKTIGNAKTLEGPAAVNEWDKVEELCAEAHHKRNLIKEETERRISAVSPTVVVDPDTLKTWLEELSTLSSEAQEAIAKAKTLTGAAAVNEWDRVEELLAEASHKRTLIAEATSKY